MLTFSIWPQILPKRLNFQGLPMMPSRLLPDWRITGPIAKPFLAGLGPLAIVVLGF
jgi:hypothetical protein